MEVQTRIDGALDFYDTVSKAYLACKNNKYLEKISFDDADGMHRFRPKLKKELWNPKSEAKLNQLSGSYHNAQPNELFWIDQPMDKFVELCSNKCKQEFLMKYIANNIPIPEHMKKYEYLSGMELIDEDECFAGSIVNVLTVGEFEQKYKC